MSAYPKKVTCPDCKGTGKLPNRSKAPCQNCQGKGWVGSLDQRVRCPICAGSKRVTVNTTKECHNCHGLGEAVVMSADEEIYFTRRDPISGITLSKITLILQPHLGRIAHHIVHQVQTCERLQSFLPIVA